MIMSSSSYDSSDMSEDEAERVREEKKQRRSVRRTTKKIDRMYKEMVEYGYTFKRFYDICSLCTFETDREFEDDIAFYGHKFPVDELRILLQEYNAPNKICKTVINRGIYGHDLNELIVKASLQMSDEQIDILLQYGNKISLETILLTYVTEEVLGLINVSRDALDDLRSFMRRHSR